VRSAHLGNERPIYVWLPLSYHESGDRTYPVLYMQDEMSPALWFNDCALLELIERAPFVEGRIYLDMGTAEGDEHVKHVQQLHQQLLRKGYRPGQTLFYVEEDDAGHDEDAWARRLRTALYFLLPCVPAAGNSSDT
jgi:predicted alpha/beta superfamily hydrolase